MPREDDMGSAHTTGQAATLPDGYFARAATTDDAQLVAQLRAAYQAAEGDISVITAEEQLNDWQGVTLAEDTTLVFAPDGSLVAHADIMNRRNILISVYGGVHPQYLHQGLGAYLVRWGETWARDRMGSAPADARVAVQHYINAQNEQASALMESLGYAYAHTIYVMRIVMNEPPPVSERIEGVSIRAFVPGQDERPTFDAIEESFRDLRDRPAGDFDRWLALTENERRQPDSWFLAQDEQSGEVVGTCLARIVPGGGGWIGNVGVRRPWRRRGLALALLLTAFGALYQRGEREVELSVDAGSPTGAPRLYSRAGMHVSHSVSLYRRELRPGIDYNTYSATESA